MSSRGEQFEDLADTLGDADFSYNQNDSSDEPTTCIKRGTPVEAVAEHLLAAGYRKPRAITTAEELDALPAKSAILDRDGTPWVSDGDNVEPWASVCEVHNAGPIWMDSVDIPLPATVLYEPEPQS